MLDFAISSNFSKKKNIFEVYITRLQHNKVVLQTLICLIKLDMYNVYIYIYIYLIQQFPYIQCALDIQQLKKKF